MKRISDKEIHRIIDHWNPLPSRLDGIAPETIKFRLFSFVAQAQLGSCEKEMEQRELLIEGYVEQAKEAREKEHKEKVKALEGIIDKLVKGGLQ